MSQADDRFAILLDDRRQALRGVEILPDRWAEERKELIDD
jgi:hypothetical protein